MSKYIQWLIFAVLGAFLGLVCVKAFASEYHQKGQSHRVVYYVTDSSGKPVTGQTVRLQVIRVSDDAIYDFSDRTFKFSSWTTRYQTMGYNPSGEYYGFTITPDSGRIISGDYICVVSNDDATYGDHNAEVVNFDSVSEQIRMNR